MTPVDTTDGILMVGACGWAFITQIRKLYYNLTIAFVALMVGGIQRLIPSMFVVVMRVVVVVLMRMRGRFVAVLVSVLNSGILWSRTRGVRMLMLRIVVGVRMRMDDFVVSVRMRMRSHRW
jgi:hypothetical protein